MQIRRKNFIGGNGKACVISEHVSDTIKSWSVFNYEKFRWKYDCLPYKFQKNSNKYFPF